MNKQDCLLQLGEAQREINGFRNAAHLTDLQIEGYCKRIIELTARDAKLREKLIVISLNRQAMSILKKRLKVFVRRCCWCEGDENE